MDQDGDGYDAVRTVQCLVISRVQLSIETVNLQLRKSKKEKEKKGFYSSKLIVNRGGY